MTERLIQTIRVRADHRCEYCHVPSTLYAGFFHLDHVIARQHGGKTDLSNLALACMHCNRHKGPNIAGTDPVTGDIVRLFDPRRDDWHDHFAWQGTELTGKTAIGRTTISVLAINDPEFQSVRAALTNDLVNWD